MAVYATGVLEACGIAVVFLLALYAILGAAVLLLRRQEGREVFRQSRQRLIRGIVLGLEFLVAADIIRTVAIDLSLRSLGVLAIIVLIRTFLSLMLEIEMTGRWPWHSEGTP